MKKMMICLQFAAVLAVTPLLAVESEIQFKHESWKEILEKGKKENKPVFIDAYAEWCGPCHKMAENTFTDSSVAVYMNDSYICIKIDVDSDEGQAFQKEYEIEYLPTSLFFDAKGDLKVKETGFQEPEAFLSLARRALGEDPAFNEMLEMQKKFEAGDTSSDLVTKLLMKKIDFSSDEGLGDICRSVLLNRNPEVLKVDTFFYAFYLITDKDYNSTMNLYFRDNFMVLYDQYGTIAYNKAIEIIANRIQEAADQKNKKLLKGVFEFYKTINPEAKKSEVRKLYKSDLKENKEAN